jgi:hypothetical protein
MKSKTRKVKKSRTRNVKKSRKGGLFYMTNSKKTYEDNFRNYETIWKPLGKVWDPKMNYPGISNPGSQPSLLKKPLPCSTCKKW